MGLVDTLPKQNERERQAGLLLLLAAAAALLAANSPLEAAYHDLLHFELGLALPRFGPLTVHNLVSDGLMAIFFLLVGMEVKREWYEGRLANRQARQLPIIAAVAGMVVPALVFLAVSGGDPQLARGWAIPTATDIAFAIAVLAILGPRAPPSIKLLLVSVAIVDDVGAIAVIALVYTQEISSVALGSAAAVVVGMALMNMLGVRRSWPYLIGFAILWWLVLASGVHATIAGVLAAMTIPLGPGESHSTLEHLEQRLHGWVMFAIVPLFGFVSSGVHFAGWQLILQPLPLAVGLGLLIGKPLGVFAAIRIGDALGVCCRPLGASWLQIYGASVLCGIGFTMSLFIGAIAFPQQPEYVESAKIGTLVGSLISALIGWAVMRAASAAPRSTEGAEAAERIFGLKHRHSPAAGHDDASRCRNSANSQ